MIPGQCPSCGSRRIEWHMIGSRWKCKNCNCEFSRNGEILYDHFWKPDQEAHLTSKKGGYCVDLEMIKGGRMPRGSTNEGGQT
jgi:hypothetical protein